MAPSQVVQYKSNHIPYYNEETYSKIKNCNLLLTTAIKSKNQNDWRNFRNNRNILDKELKKLKSNYISEKMTYTKNNWKLVKQFNKLLYTCILKVPVCLTKRCATLKPQKLWAYKEIVSV